ncbi:MAG TPA: type IV pilus assembly protein PilM [Candidatus Saccharimonadia bacterium]|nr:type IV pilus assembly protein PilM [Candidatus Saccharimonadia bacterium]
MSSSVGIDIGTYAIKIVELEKAGKGFEISKALLVPNSSGLVVPVQQTDREKLLEQLKHIFKEQHFPQTDLHIGLPEAFISTKIVSMPPLSDVELASAITWQAEQYIPIPTEDLQLEYHVLFRPPKTDLTNQMRVLLLGASKKTVMDFSQIFYDSGLDIATLETQMLSLYRLAIQDANLPTTLIVHLGASTTDMLIIHEKELAFVYSYPNGGLVLSRAVERGLGLDPNQAEEYKRTYGIDGGQLEGKVMQAILPIFRPFVTEIQKALQYFTGTHQGAVVKRILLSGGSAALPGIVPTIAELIPLEISLFSPFAAAPLGKGLTVPPFDAPAYTVATGLAMGGFV